MPIFNQKGAQLNPDGAVLLPVVPSEGGPIRQAQGVLAAWAGMVGA